MLSKFFPTCAVIAAALSAPAWAETRITGDLPRHAELGFATDEAAGGLTVRKAGAGSPLHDGDVILAVDGRSFARPYEGSALLQRLRGGDRVELQIRRAGSLRAVRIAPPPAPYEERPGEEIEYGVVRTSDGAQLRTILSRPSGVRVPAPALFFTQWVSCGSIEGPGNAVAQLRALAARAGMALIRVERSGAGDSLGPACHELDYDTEVRHYREALDSLRRHPWIDPRRIAIYGSSLGGTTAPLVAAGRPVAGILVQGAGALTYVERMIAFDRIGLERSGASPGEIDRRMRQSVAFHSLYLLDGKDPEAIARERPDLAGVWSHIRGSGDGVHYGRPYAWHRQAARRDFLEAWSKVEAPVLVVYGEYDQYETRHGHEIIVRTLNRLRPGSATFAEIAGADHELELYGSPEDALAYHGGRANPELFLRPASDWLKRVTSNAAPAAAQAPSPALASYDRARALLDAGLDALGGEAALRALRSVERDTVVSWVDPGQQATPWTGTADVDRLPVGERIPTRIFADYAGRRFIKEERFDEVPADRFVHRDVVAPDGSFETGRYHEERPFFASHTAQDADRLRRREQRLLPEALLLLARDRSATLEWQGELAGAGRRLQTISFADIDGERLLLTFDASTRLLAAVEWLRDHPVLGDTKAGVVFEDYRAVGLVKLPHRYYTTIGGLPSRDYRIRSIGLDEAPPAELLAAPRDAVPIESPPPEPVLRAIGGAVYEILGPYNVMFAVFEDYVLLVEAPVDEAYTAKIYSLIRSVAPGKRVEVVATHFHWDHIGGARFAVSQGSPIWTTDDGATAIRQALGSRRTLQPDTLARSPREPLLRRIGARKVFDDGLQRVEILDVGPTDHVAHLLVAWFPRTETLLAADLWDVLNAEMPIPGNDAALMMERLDRAGIRVARMVPVHGVPAGREALARGFDLRRKYLDGRRR
jgi:glyoxylase-like metal-dependent hydrolase (beta-lactamase superfamily II)/alpha-beta hydrolase superfamily lysophospholipase